MRGFTLTSFVTCRLFRRAMGETHVRQYWGTVKLFYMYHNTVLWGIL